MQILVKEKWNKEKIQINQLCVKVNEIYFIHFIFIFKVFFLIYSKQNFFQTASINVCIFFKLYILVSFRISRRCLFFQFFLLFYLSA